MEWQGTQHTLAEGPLARAIESRTARLPSDVFLWTALGAMGTSLALRLLGRRFAAQFVGEWVPTVLLFGVYDKIVKVAGHDRAGARRMRTSAPASERPAGNAIYDPRRQTRRRDMPENEQPSTGATFRGTSPSLERDESNQPHTHEPSEDRPF